MRRLTVLHSNLVLLFILFRTVHAGAEEPREAWLRDTQIVQRKPELVPFDCPVELSESIDAYCGLITVPETYDASSRVIRVAVLVAAAVAPTGQPPVIYLNGGPGYPAIVEAPAILGSGTHLDAVRQTRDVIFLDQRGTGFSRPVLNCPELDGAYSDVANGEGSPAQLAALKACRTRLVDEGVNLAAYRTDLSSRDLDEVRRALGYEKMSLYGASYGAALGLQRLRNTPDWLESAVLFGVSDPSHDTYAEWAPKYQRALEALDQACSMRPECLAAHGHLRDNIVQVVRAFERGPKTITYPDFETRVPQTITVTLADIVEGLYQLTTRSGVLPWLPLMFAEAARGEYEQLISIGVAVLFGGGGTGPDSRSHGMRWSVLCSENMAYSSRASFRSHARGTDRAVRHLLPGELQRFDICDVWDVPPAPPWRHLPVVSRTPTLLISGSFDHTTPSENAERVSRFLLRDQHVALASSAHSGDLSCETELMTAFFASPGQSLDSSCAERPIRFVYRRPDGFELR